MTLAVARALYDSVTAQLADMACGIPISSNAQEEMTMPTEKLTAETITADQITTLRAEAGAAGDAKQVALCDDALQQLRDRERGMVEWSSSKPPREIVACVDAINDARAMENS